MALKKLEGKIEKLRPTKLTKDRYKGLSLKQKAQAIKLEGEKLNLNTKFQEVGFG